MIHWQAIEHLTQINRSTPPPPPPTLPWGCWISCLLASPGSCSLFFSPASPPSVIVAGRAVALWPPVAEKKTHQWLIDFGNSFFFLCELHLQLLSCFQQTFLGVCFSFSKLQTFLYLLWAFSLELHFHAKQLSLVSVIYLLQHIFV